MIIHWFPLHFLFVFFLIKNLFLLDFIWSLWKLAASFLYWVLLKLPSHSSKCQSLTTNPRDNKKKISPVIIVIKILSKIFITPWLLVTMEFLSLCFFLYIFAFNWSFCYKFSSFYIHQVFINCQSQITTPSLLNRFFR